MNDMKWWKVTLVIGGALLITALGIDAADTFKGSGGTLLSQVISKNTGICPSGMVEVTGVQNVTCVDAFEVSPGTSCPSLNPEQAIATQENIRSRECKGESKADALPWRFITRDQALQICARDGKRLPTSAEWYALSLGMIDVENSCNIRSGKVSQTGTYTECVTGNEVFDLVGNVWEWVSDDVIQGEWNNRLLPGSGYVNQVDSAGMALSLGEAPDSLFESDFFWSKSEGSYGVIRGGYYDSGSDAGIYTVHADTLPTSASAGMGFRCVR